MIDVRDNWRVLLLVALCVLAALALFGPLGASGDDGFGLDPTPPDPLATATSGDAGEYGIELPAGEYEVLVDETGYERFEAELEVTPGNTTALDISLSERPTGTVSGVVSGPDGAVENTTIAFLDNETGEVERAVTTAADGSYEVTLDTGEYTVEVDEIGFETFDEEVSVVEGETESLDIDLVSTETGTVEGAVSADGEPVGGIEISVADNATGEPLTTVRTDADGTYEVTLETGEVDLQINDPRFERFSTAVLVQTDATQTADLTLDAHETATVSGSVTADGEPVTGVDVAFRDIGTQEQLAVATTDESGEYELELALEEYEMRVDELLFETVEREVSVTGDGAGQFDIELERLETGTVEGVISDGDGTLSGIDIEFLDPEAGLGEDIDESGFGDPTNLQYGLELSGGARIRGQLVGMTAEEVGMPADAGSQRQITSTVAEELGLEQIDVRARGELDAIEIYTQNVTQTEFADALEAAGLTVEPGDIRNGVTEPTRQEAITTITDRVDQTGLSGADVFTSSAVSGENFLVTEVPGVTRAELREIISDTGRVQIIAGFPETTENGTVYNQTTLLTQEDISGVDRAQAANAENPSPHVPVTLTSEAGARFANVMREAGFTQEGVGNCFFDEDEHDTPAPEHENQYCLFTVVDGEYVYGSSMGADLAQTINSGGFQQNPSFIMQTGSFQEAQQLEVNLRAGELPTDIEIVTESFISPSLAQLFKPLALLTALIAWLSVCAVVYYWYRDARIAIPMLVTASSEVFLLLGFAAAVGMALDLSHIAGFIAVIGTGLDDLIIMADEILQRKQTVETGRVFRSRFRKAFWIIGMAAATTIIAMSPLAVLSLGDLQGFAIVTIVGVLIGVAITRPAYGDVLRKLMLDDVDRK